ncbi:protocadherin-16-like [Gigantopelta aegis]|uniref:protocadherin-16-like n=1 Tax=Gigantopelta aegis TaxID=1735272 RepID=UPI001B88CCC3|nr:protocadherin-16-like [Gigantopelta aegis]
MEQVPEDASIGRIITTVTAHDGDLGISNPVTVSMEQKGVCSTLFAIDKSSGTLTVARSLNRERNNLNNGNGACNITIKATEHSEQGSQFGDLTSTTFVIVLITDVNDHHPTFNVATFTGEVLRTARVGMPVVVAEPIIVEDKDMGINGAMEFYLETVNGTHDATFDVIPKMAFSYAQLYLKVLNSTALRNYKHERISLGVVARESKTQRRHSNMVTVHIKIRNQITDICSHVHS